MRCPNCGKLLDGHSVCSCGYDRSRDYANFPTLTLISTSDLWVPKPKPEPEQTASALDQTELQAKQAIACLEELSRLVEQLEADPLWMNDLTLDDLARYRLRMQTFLRHYQAKQRLSHAMAAAPSTLFAIGGDCVTVLSPEHRMYQLPGDAAPITLDRQHYCQLDAMPWHHSVVGLRDDGTAFLMPTAGITMKPLNAFTDIIQIAVGGGFTLGLKENGTVVSIGELPQGVGTINLSGWRKIQQIATGITHCAALRRDGTVLACGSDFHCECQVGSWAHIREIKAGWNFTAGLLENGTVCTAGYPLSLESAADWKNIRAIAAGKAHLVGLCRDGTVVAAGDNSRGQCDVSTWTDIAFLYARCETTVGVRRDGSFVAAGKFAQELNSLRLD